MSTNTKTCIHCGSDGHRFTAEVAIPLPGTPGVSQSIVWVFPELHVCSNCGFAEFTVPGRELQMLRDGVHAEGALISTTVSHQ